MKASLKDRSLEYDCHLRQRFNVSQAGKIADKMAEFVRPIRKRIAVAETPEDILSDQTEMFFKINSGPYR